LDEHLKEFSDKDDNYEFMVKLTVANWANSNRDDSLKSAVPPALIRYSYASLSTELSSVFADLQDIFQAREKKMNELANGIIFTKEKIFQISGVYNSSQKTYDLAGNDDLLRINFAGKPVEIIRRELTNPQLGRTVFFLFV
jgi:hypothetical protein